eukprot:CAMPEP_0183455842 /NCGR_PEP_ID=MMETSP0370-20130417/127531_1 /TAXON_ID=268820 /ORGANISM="Peridinium aciculiferum, Strain PAER-2" /LENGTH=164 /DNA_ID=CAMNT_0025647453 /DNA_START=34 /DNA_END=525 /DNA_ORIENTATION=+
MSSTATSTAQMRLHVEVQAEAPVERFCLVGSSKALGQWNPKHGVGLEWMGGTWMTRQPVTLKPRERVDFKFLKIVGSTMEWEGDPNRVLDVPPGDADLKLKGRFNAHTILSLAEGADGRPSTSQAAEAASARAEAAAGAAWRRSVEEAESMVAESQNDLRARRE